MRRIIQNPGIYLREILVKLQLGFGVRVGAITICPTPRFIRQAMRHVAIQQSESMGTKFMAVYYPTMLLWTDVLTTTSASGSLDRACRECVQLSQAFF